MISRFLWWDSHNKSLIHSVACSNCHKDWCENCSQEHTYNQCDYNNVSAARGCLKFRATILTTGKKQASCYFFWICSVFFAKDSSTPISSEKTKVALSDTVSLAIINFTGRALVSLYWCSWLEWFWSSPNVSTAIYNLLKHRLVPKLIALVLINLFDKWLLTILADGLCLKWSNTTVRAYGMIMNCLTWPACRCVKWHFVWNL